MAKHIVLSYFSSDVIKEFCANNPIDWADREVANTFGNLLTPTSAMAVFFDLLTQYGNLFTQSEYVRGAWVTWGDWKSELERDAIVKIEARLYRNFYPSAIDSLHVWALLVESGQFARCILDTAQDAYSKTDLTVWTCEGNLAKIALSAGNKYSQQWARYKRRVRGGASDAINILLPMNRRKFPGNKRWYRLEDLMPVFEALEVEIPTSYQTAMAI